MIVLKTVYRFRKSEILEYLLTISAAVVSRLSMLLITLVNTQIMPREEFGLFVILLLIANMVSAFVSCGGDSWLNRFSRQRHSIQNSTPFVSGLYFNISACLAGIVILCALYFGIFGKEMFHGRGLGIAWCLLWAAIAGVIETILAILRASNTIKRFFIIRDFFMPITLITSIIVLKIDTIEFFFMTAFIIWLVTFGFLWSLISKKKHLYLPPFHWRGRLFKKVIIGHTVSLILNNFLSRLANAQDTFLIARTELITIAGQYRFVSHFAHAFNIIQHFVFLAFPWQLRQATSNKIQGELEEIRVVRFRQLLLLASAFPALIMLIFITKPLLTVINPEFQLMALPFSIFLIIRFSELLWGPQHEILISNKKINWDTLSNVIASCIGALIFFIALYSKDAVTSGLIAVGFSSIAGKFTQYLILKKYYLTKNIQNFGIKPWCPVLIVIISLLYVVIK